MVSGGIGARLSGDSRAPWVVFKMSGKGGIDMVARDGDTDEELGGGGGYEGGAETTGGVLT